MQRYLTAKSDKDAKFSALFGGYLYIPVSALFFLIGTALYSYYTLHPGLPQEITAKPDYVFPFFIVNSLPIGVRGVLIASIFAAGMSTVSTSIPSAATIVLEDYYKPIREKLNYDSADRQHVLVFKIASCVIGLIGIIVAIAMLSVESIIDAWWKLSSIFSGGMLGLFLLGWIPGTIKKSAALIGCIAGILLIGAITFGILPLHSYLAIVVGTTAIFLTGFLLTLLLK